MTEYEYIVVPSAQRKISSCLNQLGREQWRVIYITETRIRQREPGKYQDEFVFFCERERIAGREFSDMVKDMIHGDYYL